MPQVKSDWFTITALDNCTYAISEYGHWEKVHSFLLLGETKAALIDTGLGIAPIRPIATKLTSLPIIVLTTHVHTDHIGGHGEYEHTFVHRADAGWLENGIKGLSIDQIRHNISRDITIPTPSTFNPATYVPYQGKPSGILEDGDEIDLGNRKLTVYHTPGHSPGHITIMDNTFGYLFTGDLLYDQTPVYAFYPSTDPVALVNSWERIAKLPGITKVFGSHNTLGLNPSILQEVKAAVRELKERDVVRHGTGLHQFKTISVQF